MSKEKNKERFGLSEKEFKKIIESAARAANKEQRELVERVEKRERENGKPNHRQMVCDAPK